MLSKPQQLSLKDFKAGLITRLPETEIPDNAFSDCENIDLNEKYLPTKRKGTLRYNSNPFVDVPKSGFLYMMEDGTKYYIIAINEISTVKLYYSIAGSGTFTAYQIGGVGVTMVIGTEGTIEFVQYLNSVYIINGKYPVISNAGYTTSRMLKINGTTITALTDVNIPQGGKYIIKHQERLFVFGSLDNKNGLYWTEPFLPEDWTPDWGQNYDYIGKDDGEIGTGIISFQGFVLCGKPHNIYLMSTIGDITSWTKRRVDTKLGILYHRTVQEFYGVLLYLSPEGVAMFDGNNARLVSEQIRDKILDLQQMVKGEQSWQKTTTDDFQIGSYGNVISIADNLIQQNPQTSQADFLAGVMGNVDLWTIAGSIKIGNSSIPTPMPLMLGGELVFVKDIVTSHCYLYLAGMSVTTSEHYFKRYSLIDNTWTDLVSLPAWAPQRYLSLAYPGSGDYIYAFDRNSSDCFKYSISLNSWSSIASSGIVDLRNTISTNDDFIYVVSLDYFKKYTISTNTWETLTNPNTYMWGALFYPFGDYLYANAADPNINKYIYKYKLTAPFGWTLVGVDPNLGISTIAIDNDYAFFISSGQLRKYQISTNTIVNSYTVPTSAIIIPSIEVQNGCVYIFQNSTNPLANHFYKFLVGNGYNVFNSTTNYFITKTLDYAFTPTTFGNLSATLLGSGITFQTKSSATDLTLQQWRDDAGWTNIGVSGENGGAINSALNRYLRVRIVFSSTGGTVYDIYVGALYRSEKKDLGGIPGSWGTFDTAFYLAGQTITFWMRSATTSVLLDTATWYLQTPNGAISGVPLNQWIQIEIRLNTANSIQIPFVDSFGIVWYSTTVMISPCAIVWKNNYWLCVADTGQTTNNIVYVFNKEGYWLKWTNIWATFFFYDEDRLFGSSQLYLGAGGFLFRYDFSNFDDDPLEYPHPVDTWFETKNFEFGNFIKVFRKFKLKVQNNASFFFSYSIDNGSYQSIAIPVNAVTKSLRKVFSGIQRGQYIKFKIRNYGNDPNFEFHELELTYAILRELAVT